MGFFKKAFTPHFNDSSLSDLYKTIKGEVHNFMNNPRKTMDYTNKYGTRTEEYKTGIFGAKKTLITFDHNKRREVHNEEWEREANDKLSRIVNSLLGKIGCRYILNNGNTSTSCPSGYNLTGILLNGTEKYIDIVKKLDIYFSANSKYIK